MRGPQGHKYNVQSNIPLLLLDVNVLVIYFDYYTKLTTNNRRLSVLITYLEHILA